MASRPITSPENVVSGEPRTRFGRAYFRYAVEPWLYASPAILLICFVMLIPLAIGIAYSVQSINLLKPFDTGFVGLENFRDLADDRKFWRALNNTFWWTFGSVTLQFLLGLGLALLLSRPLVGKRFVQAVVFLPWAVPTFLIALTWSWLLNPVIGPLPHWWAAIGLLDEPYNILSNPDTAIWGPIMANVWYGIPFFAITLLAALQSIPGELYEAAEIDGASRWQCFTKITLPFLGPMIAITVMLRAIWIANFADLIYVMTGGGPADSTQILSTYIFTTAFRKLDFGYASAIAVALLGVLFIYAAVLLFVRAKLVKF
ncbi:sugar ABC transporter permease [Mameliella alba]|uniref:Binding protein-dependent transport system, inner membrane component n=1 Tax=Mameliella alba TaxID=561184 RepID=A0A0B3RK97_9RHOB|nr:Binding protein-dependent transport system, inner membrane component [Mameliella alba]MBY6120367.1 sugar ABC transporter permease [Mameliella alba]OWV46273.1 sugar ABC transporter permease [Mameliella alba]OWV60604.1 sugar ABC transporter permease [Mameliella alba]GGF74996.1 sugar ABC transporter permease [Mameliella alba]